MCAPSPPPPPDYAGAATAQGAANKETAIASSRLNNPNVFNPLGTQTWQEGALPDDRPTLTQTFSPEQQSLYEKSLASKGLLADLGTQGATALKGVVGQGMDFSGAPPSPGDSAALRDQVINSMMQRVNEDTGRAIEDKNSQLIAAGIRPGTKAYDDAMALIERNRTDARTQAMLAGGTEAQRSFGMDAQRRKDAIAELLAQRQTPLNEINALMSGSQVSNPFAVPGAAQNTNIAPPPIFGAAQAQYGSQVDAYNAQAQGQAGLMSGLFGLGSAAMGAPWAGKMFGF